jgi:allantoate deiminase
VNGEAESPGHLTVRWIEELARFSDSADGLTRLYLSEAHRQAADYVSNLMNDAGLVTTMSPLGDVVGVSSHEPNRPVIIIGSHIDTVRNAGRYDGALGVLAGIEVAHRLKNSDMPFDVAVAAFGDEEGVRFPTTLSGSRAAAGFFDAVILQEKDETGLTRGDALKAFGCNASGNPEKHWERFRKIAYLEVHIEQGPILESEALALGVVTSIAGAIRATVKLTGEAGHAGTVPMAMRRDALVAASEMVLAIEKVARNADGVVATVGKLEIADSARNTVPGLVSFTIDLRSGEDQVRDDAWRAIEARLKSLSVQRNVGIEIEINHKAAAAACDPKLVAFLSQGIESLGLTPRQLVSGAGHDAMAFAGKVPFGMLFVRCKSGKSHTPEEFASAEDIGLAVNALQNTLDIMARNWPQ